MQLDAEDERQIRDALDEMEASLRTIRRILRPEGEEERLHPKFEVLRGVYEEGGIVSEERWHELGAEHGYDDPRGLAGLFAHGKWVEKILRDQVALTDEAEEELKAMGLVED